MTVAPQTRTDDQGRAGPECAEVAAEIVRLRQQTERARRAAAEHHAATEALSQTERRLRRQNDALTSLSTRGVMESGDFCHALSAITETAGQTLEVQRVSVWFRNAEGSKIECVERYERGPDRHLEAAALCDERFPVPPYFDIFRSQRFVSIEDAQSDQRVCDFRDAYLRSHGIDSILDAPIHHDGKMIGVLCHEHVGSSRRWTIDEQQFAASMADFVALAIAARDRRRAAEALKKAHAALTQRSAQRDAALSKTDRELEDQITRHQRTKDALKQSESQFRCLYESDIIGVIFADSDGGIADANDAFLHMVGYEREDLPLCWTDMTPPEWRRIDERVTQKFLTEGATRAWEKEYFRKDGSRVPVLLGAARIEGRRNESVCFVLDLTDLKRTEAKLANETEISRLVVESISEGVFVCDHQGEVTLLNPAALEIMKLESFNVPPEQRPRVGGLYLADRKTLYPAEQLPAMRALRGEKVDDELIYVQRPDQDEGVWINVSARPLKSGPDGPRGAVALFRNVTEKHNADEAIRQEQRRMRQMLMAHERDRTLTAYEIHDGLVQDLAAALMHFEAFCQRQPLSPGRPQEEFDEGLRLLRNSLDEGRRLISGLRPPIIDEQGLSAAIEYLVSERSVASGIDIEFVCRISFGRLEPLLEGTVFRVAQEALNNVVLHSGANRCRVELLQQEDRLRLEVRDWGVGFDTSTVHENRYGLQGIRERTRLLQGSAVIESSPDMGTRIMVELPVRTSVSPASQAEG